MEPDLDVIRVVLTPRRLVQRLELFAVGGDGVGAKQVAERGAAGRRVRAFLAEHADPSRVWSYGVVSG